MSTADSEFQRRVAELRAKLDDTKAKLTAMLTAKFTPAKPQAAPDAKAARPTGPAFSSLPHNSPEWRRYMTGEPEPALPTDGGNVSSLPWNHPDRLANNKNRGEV